MNRIYKPPTWFFLCGVLATFANAGMAGVPTYDIKTAEILKLSCNDYTLRVTGVADKGYCVTYNFTLTPDNNGSPTTVSGQIPVDGNFDVSKSGVFSLATSGVFQGSGSAKLRTSCSAPSYINSVPIDFGVTTPLNCPSPPAPKVEIKKFTNGHDGDDANGVPTAGPGDFKNPGTVAQIPATDDVTWTYRVTNTGNEKLVKVRVVDNQFGDITQYCRKEIDPLDVGESVDCTVTSTAVSLVLNPPDVVEGCGDKRPTYANVGKVTAEGATTGTPVEDSDHSHYCNPKPPACNLMLDKTCEIVQPTGPDWASCKGKIQEFKMIWPSTGGTINISGIANDAPDGVVKPGQKVTFSGPFSSNDLYLNLSGAVNGQSTFHVSCSDKDMDGLTATNLSQQQLQDKTQDCGKFEGDGKAKSGTWINTWLLDGLVDAEGKVLNCSPTPTPSTSSCSFQQEEPPQCGTGGSFKPSTLTFQYTGGGCQTQSNSQDPGKTSCSGSIDKTKTVTVTANNGDGPFTVTPGGTFTINRNQSNTVFTLTNAGGTESDSIHTSCSQPLIVGDVYFSLTLVAEDAVGPGKQVKYSYKVTNTGSTTATGISVEDDMLGTIGNIASLNAGNSTMLTKTALIEQTTVNTATATGPSCPDGVKATATVTVQPPPPCTVTEVLYDLTDDKIVYKVTNTGNKVVTYDTLTVNFPVTRGKIKVVKREGDNIYEASKSNLVVMPGVTIGASDWTNTDVNKRTIKPGETKKLEIQFTTKAKSTASDFSGTATFKEGCEIDLGQ